MLTSIMGHIVEPFAECLTEGAAKKIVALRADPELQHRVDELAGRSNRGQLSPDERNEHDQYLAAFHFITVIQSRARRFLNA